MRVVSAPRLERDFLVQPPLPLQCDVLLHLEAFLATWQTEPSTLVKSIREWPHMDVSIGDFSITCPSQEGGRIYIGEVLLCSFV
jgi:hypothetical protein